MKNDQAHGGKTESEYLLLFRGPDWDHGLPAEELKRLMDGVLAWLNDLTTQGRVAGGQPLDRTGFTVAGAQGRPVDGPFVESKETIGGFLVLRAASLEEAAAIARACPTIHHGVSIEVRPLLTECPCFERAKRRIEAELVAA
jgi:hypothetical protein